MTRTGGNPHRRKAGAGHAAPTTAGQGLPEKSSLASTAGGVGLQRRCTATKVCFGLRARDPFARSGGGGRFSDSP